MITMHNSDCFEVLPTLADKSIDLVFADLPYTCTAAEWDTPIDLAAYWRECKRLLKPGGAVVMTATFRFALEVVGASPRGWFRYDLVWDRIKKTGHLDANRRPLRRHELLLVFGPRMPRFTPVKTTGHKPTKGVCGTSGALYGAIAKATPHSNDGSRFPTSILAVNSGAKRLHPTEKPVELLEWILKSYTSEGDLVLDPTMGAGSTLVACANLGRDGCGIERNVEFFEMARSRLA